VIALLNTAAEVVRDLAILTAAAIALLGFLLGASTKVVTPGGSVVVWRLPLFRRVKVVGQARQPLSAHDVVKDSETGVGLGGEAATLDAMRAGAGDENPPVSVSAWFHVPAAIDRSRDPVELPAIALRRASKRKRKRLNLRAESVATELVDDPPSLRIDVSGDQGPGSGVELSEPDAGRLRDALVGTWISNLWS
jgi:hypothetical protein